MSSFCGSRISSAVTIQGPVGALVSNALPRPSSYNVKRPDFRTCRSRAVTSLTMISEHVVKRVFDRDVPAGFADDDRQFRLAIELPRQSFIVADIFTRADHAVRGFDKKLRLLAARRRAGFLIVVFTIIAAGAKNRCWKYRRREFY